MLSPDIKLTERESQIIKMRFGIGAFEAMTLEQVGAHFGVTRERVRQIETKALTKLRRSKVMQSLKEDYL
jgi:RNA polymerase primary sigma factor